MAQVSPNQFGAPPWCVGDGQECGSFLAFEGGQDLLHLLAVDRLPIHSGSTTLDRLDALVERLEKATTCEPEFATVAQAARRLGIGTKALRGAIQRGEILVYDLGTRARGRRRVHVPEVRAWALDTACDPMAKARAAGDAAARSSLPRSNRKH